MASVTEHGRVGRPRMLKRNELGQRIDKILQTRGMNIHDLADACKISSASLYRICTGDTPDPRVSTIVAIADALGVTVDRLVASPRRSTRRTA